MALALFEHWQHTLQGTPANPAQTYAQWQAIVYAYTQPGRHYHTLQHLYTMISQLQPVFNQIANPVAFMMALFFHDFVYKTNRDDNEEASAKAAVLFLKSIHAEEDIVKKTEALIVATQHKIKPQDNDTCLLVDADLCILGAAEADYNLYVQQIRKEYRRYDDKTYQAGRKKVLEHFLARERIYQTPYFHDQFESQAKKNLERELEELR
jgi:predicted metal-dependent HD superfamily phosphohydrolase